MTPKSALGKRRAPDTPRDSGHLPDKLQCRTGVEEMFAMSKAVMKGFAGGSGPEVVPPASPEWLTKAIQLVEEEEGQCGSDVLMQAVDLFHSDPRNPIAYLDFSKKEMRSIWLHRELAQVAHNAAILDFSMLPADNTL